MFLASGQSVREYLVKQVAMTEYDPGQSSPQLGQHQGLWILQPGTQPVLHRTELWHTALYCTEL